MIQITDAALADAARRSGPHLVCHPGCTPCCHGVFAISSLDASRLQAGLVTLQQTDPPRARRIQQRTAATIAKLAPDFPGDPATGHLATDEASQARFEDFANDESCPVLDPATGTCDLYAHRPMTCRVFGPPIWSDDGLGICELCFQNATQTEIEAAEMHLPDPALEAALTAPLGDWTTIIPFAFKPDDRLNQSLPA
ncbi:YkgJ family cysteine cluster protein [Terriglobus sp.]|uniref:YkgJ family cysteine cluster protein n=1 Tax=Terriglobus sp. TaxID=1889013 RepID=UPI003B005162